MPFVAAPVKIPEDIHHILSKFSKSRTLPARQVQRAKIILLAADGMNNMQISTRVGPGQPAHYTDEQIIKILEIACREPQEFGYEVSHWSLNLLVNAVVKEGTVESISAKTVSRFLKYGGNPPTSHPLLASFLRENRFSGNFCGESE